MGLFIAHSVTAATAKAYEGHWIKWCRFINEDQVGGGSSFFRDLREGRASASHVLGFRVLTSSQKTGAHVKAKTVGRRSPEESQFLEDLVTFIAFSKVLLSDELFCRYLERRSRKVDRKRLQGRMVREAVKGVCRDAV